MRARELVLLAICLGIFVAGNVVAASVLADTPPAKHTEAVAMRPTSTVQWRNAQPRATEPAAAVL
jgi:hypothetical protein